MYPHALIDLHCDTLTALRPEDASLLDALRDPARRRDAFAALTDRVRETDTLDLPGRHFSLSALPEGVRWCQCCAIFIPDGLSQEEAATKVGKSQSAVANKLRLLRLPEEALELLRPRPSPAAPPPTLRPPGLKARQRPSSLWKTAPPWLAGWTGWRLWPGTGCG